MAQPDIAQLRIERGDKKPPRRAPRRTLVTAALCALGLAAGGAWYKYGWHAPILVEPVTVTSAYPSQAFTLLNATGYVVAQRKAAASSKATGRLEWLGVAEGSRVKQGEVIARLEDRDVGATMEQAAANVKLAQANLEQGEAELKDAQAAFNRSRELLAKGFVSSAAHDSAVARLNKAQAAVSGFNAAIAVAKASLRGAAVAVEQTRIRAPFDGVVLTKNANVGDVITPFSSATGSQAAVVTMADMGTLEVEADVSESNLAKVRPGQPCEIQLDAVPDARFPGVVHRLVPTVDRTKATVLTKIRFDEIDARVLPDMSAKVAFLTRTLTADERKPRTAVLASAVVMRNGRQVIYLIRGRTVSETAVQTGERMGDLLELKSGARPGDKVVARPADKLVDGAAVDVPVK